MHAKMETQYVHRKTARSGSKIIFKLAAGMKSSSTKKHASQRSLRVGSRMSEVISLSHTSERTLLSTTWNTFNGLEGQCIREKESYFLFV